MSFRRRRLARRGAIEGTARIGRRTKDLIHHIKPGDIAVILHKDLDQVAAEGLVERGAAAVVNCHRSITGRYPNAGPLVLSRAGIPLLDDVGEDLLDKVHDGDRIELIGAQIWKAGGHVASGTLLTGAVLDEQIALAQRAMGMELERFVRNTMEYIKTESDLVLHGIGMPEVHTQIEGKPVVVVVRGHHYKEDLRAIKSYIKSVKPVLIAVDGGADALLEEGLKPAIIIGDMDSVTSEALTSGAEVVVHAYADGTAPGLERVRALGVEPHVWPTAGTSEDIALLLAYERGADLIVAIGAHDNMVEFLDKGRAGMASTFITRLKVGPKLVDAKGVNRLYHSSVRTRDMVVLVLAALFAMGAVAWISPSLRLSVRLVIDQVVHLVGSLF